MKPYTDWKVGEKYKISNGKLAKVLITDGGGGYPIIGVIFVGGCWVPKAWSSTGLSNVVGHDLVPPEPVKHTRWVNIYPTIAYSNYHLSREAADGESTPLRIACIQITFHEGEGLDNDQISS